MEPICEAKFSNNSFGFRPNRSVEHAIAKTYRLLNLSHLHYVVEFDIKGFFDNVNHSKLVRQIWSMGIRDKHLIYIIRCILKAPIRMPDGSTVQPGQGTPQGGIISPLLANIVLNELDHWVESQWQANPVTRKYSVSINRNGSECLHHGYEIINPYEGNPINNTNLFISQYCAAKELDFASIALADMEQILRAGLTHLYSFSRTREVRTIPAEEDGADDTTEIWYIYTIRYNGEAYFADTIFALTDKQKELAENYAENLSLFLGDGLFQYAPSTNTITALGNVRFTDGATDVVYFNQLDERYANQPYGTDPIGGYGCGPTSMAIVVSSLTSETVDPAQMARWAYEHGYWCSKSGSYHTLIPGAAQAWGLTVEGCTASEPQRILDALADGKLVVALMTKGHFTKSGHFIVLRGVQDEKILVADPASYRRSQKAWDLSIILNEASRRAGAGGPFWIIG